MRSGNRGSVAPWGTKRRSGMCSPGRARLRGRAIRRGVTLTALAAATGISKSTLSRLETRQRETKPRVAAADGRGASDAARRARRRASRRRSADSDYAGEPQRRPDGGPADPAWPAGWTRGRSSCRPSVSPSSDAEGNEWLYVLSGEMRLLLGDHDMTMRAGEVAEFETRVPHWFGPAGDEPVEVLSVHGSQGQKMHIRAAPRSGFPETAPAPSRGRALVRESAQLLSERRPDGPLVPISAASRRRPLAAAQPLALAGQVDAPDTALRRALLPLDRVLRPLRRGALRDPLPRPLPTGSSTSTSA